MGDQRTRLWQQIDWDECERPGAADDDGDAEVVLEVDEPPDELPEVLPDDAALTPSYCVWCRHRFADLSDGRPVRHRDLECGFRLHLDCALYAGPGPVTCGCMREIDGESLAELTG